MVTESVVVAGEVVVDLVGDVDEGVGATYRAVPGGSPANVAVGLARLDVPTHLLARLSSGSFGTLLRGHLTASGVQLDLAVPAAQPATLAVVTLDQRRSATYEFYAEGTADWSWSDDTLPDALPDDAVALCVGSIAAFRSPGADALYGLAERTHGRAAIIVDPNIRPSLIGPPDEVGRRWDHWLPVADVVKASADDVAWLAPGSPIDDVATEWTNRGPGLAVVTRGADGAFAVTSSGLQVDVPAVAVDVVDTVGAGDAFTSALADTLRAMGALGADSRARLAALSKADLRDVLTRASAAAAITCGRRGADPPTVNDLPLPAPGDMR